MRVYVWAPWVDRARGVAPLQRTRFRTVTSFDYRVRGVRDGGLWEPAETALAGVLPNLLQSAMRGGRVGGRGRERADRTVRNRKVSRAKARLPPAFTHAALLLLDRKSVV